MKTVLDCIESGTRYLEKRGIEDARRNMQWLVAKELGCSRVELYTQFDRPLLEEELSPLRGYLKRRGEGEPLQHLLGTVEFCGHEFRCDRRALVPRPETEELVNAILERSFTRPTRLLDVGTGSGVLGLSLAKALGKDCKGVVLSDLSTDALALARENAQLLELSPIFLESDLLAEVDGGFELITANLPYVAESERASLSPEVAHDPPSALFAGPDGLDLIRHFLPKVGQHLNPGGLLAMEIGFDQGPQVVAFVKEAGLEEVQLVKDLAENPRFVFAHAPTLT
jgi:release factor glutamine methyltransferase